MSVLPVPVAMVTSIFRCDNGCACSTASFASHWYGRMRSFIGIAARRASSASKSLVSNSFNARRLWNPETLPRPVHLMANVVKPEDLAVSCIEERRTKLP